MVDLPPPRLSSPPFLARDPFVESLFIALFPPHEVVVINHSTYLRKHKFRLVQGALVVAMGDILVDY